MTSFSKKGNFLFILVLKREDDLISFSVLPSRLFHVAGPLMEIRNLHLRNIICGILEFPLETRVGYEWAGCSNCSRYDDGEVLFFILCMKTAVLSTLSLYTMSISQDSKRSLEW